MAKVFFPQNIFSKIPFDFLSEEIKQQITFEKSASLSLQLRNNESSVALIPVTDIITNKEFFISKKFGISFEEVLSNIYIYYESAGKNIDTIQLTGDVSTIEVILGKILFSELYNTDVEMSISTAEKNLPKGNFILTGNKNFENDVFSKAISFSEEMIEIISAPFVNYVLASNDKELIAEYEKIFLEAAKKIDIDEVKLPAEFTADSVKLFREKLPSVIYELNIQDVEGINNIIRLPYYYGLIKDIIEVKFV